MIELINFIKREIVFVISGVLAIIASFFVKPSLGYLEYIDFSVLIILFCLMACVGGLNKYGAFELVSRKLLKNNEKKKVSALLVLMCFFFSMIVTNDVALITFVPLTISLSKDTSSNNLIYIIVVETISANLGSLVTPIGNPQNLFIYNHYKLNIIDFLRISIPLGIVGFVLVCILIIICRKCEWKDYSKNFQRKYDKNKIVLFCLLFVICIATVLKFISGILCLALVVGALLIFERSIFLEIDYWLLLTFINFFILVGNIGQSHIINQLVYEIIRNHEFFVGVIFSQIISNVPATIMLSTFTDNYIELFQGVNIGGLGTLIASLASIISFKYYSFAIGASKRRYILCFTITNVLIMIPLLLIFR